MDDAGALLPTGAQGEVVIQGPNVIDGYENNPEANAASFTDGWFRTGDHGVLDADGYLTLVGRLKELINRGGEKIAPREIDEVLLQHPAVAEAVAFGVPHPIWGEEVAAAVVLQGEASEGAAAPLPRAPGRLQGAEEVPHRRDDPAHGHRQDPAPPRRGGAWRGRHEDRDRRGRRDRRLPRRAAGARRRGRDADRARPAPGGDARQRRARCIEATAASSSPTRRAPTTWRGGRRRRRLPDAQGAQPAGPGAATGRGARPGDGRRDAQNGIPWWYFQRYAGPLAGTHLESGRPGRRDRAQHPDRARDRLRRLAGDRAGRAGRDRAHRGHALHPRRARRHEECALPGARRGADRGRPEGAGQHPDPPRDLAEAARQRRLQSAQRADPRHARPRSPGCPRRARSPAP